MTAAPRAESRVRRLAQTARRVMSGRLYTYSILVVAGVATGIVSLALGASRLGGELTALYFTSAPVLLLNLLPPVLLILLLYFATGRAWLSFLPTALFITALSAVSFYKMMLRSEPLLLTDFAFASEAGRILSSYTIILYPKILLAFGCVLAGTLFCVFFVKRVERAPRVRLIGLAAALAVTGILYPALYRSEALFASSAAGYTRSTWSAAEARLARGFLYQFIYSAKDTGLPPPAGYSDEEAEEIIAEYPQEDIPEDKRVNVISVMLESYADLSVFDEIPLAADVYGPLHALQEESVSGRIVSNVFAGGTIDTERLFLTGFTKLTEYAGPTNSFVYYLKQQGYFAEGLHAGEEDFYERRSVNGYLGFDRYFFLEDYEDASRLDSFFFPELRRLYEERDKSVPYFNFSVSYQNHGSYYDNWTVDTAYLDREGLSDAAYNILNNYLDGIYDTTRRLEEFIDAFREDPEPVVILLFGDHMPWLGDYESVYLELGINMNSGTEEGFYNVYSTPYILWANPAARSVLGDGFTGDGGSFSPCFLMQELFARCSFTGDGYMRALGALRSRTDIISTPTAYFREDGGLTWTLSEDAKKIFEQFQILEFGRLKNFSY